MTSFAGTDAGTGSAAARRPGTQVRRRIERVTVSAAGAASRTVRDALATEEPLEIRVSGPDVEPFAVSVTMRTPGADFELAAGFLYGEGLVSGIDQIVTIRYCVDGIAKEQLYNIVTVELAAGVRLSPLDVQRNFYTTSSCGVCGKASIEAVLGEACGQVGWELSTTPELLLSLPAVLRSSQAVFDRTGGLHAAALFDLTGELLCLREDVGRHNAMDKVVGASLMRGDLPLGPRILLVSGRLSFELVQKAARAGVELLAGVSAPSSLAVELASEAGLTLVGFLREGGFNIYTGAERVQVQKSSVVEPA